MSSTYTHPVSVQLIPASATESTGALQVNHFPIQLGRGEDIDFQVQDRWLSRQHCEIDCYNGVVVVRDLNSRHGTFVNEVQIQESVLAAGDELRIGLTRFAIVILTE